MGLKSFRPSTPSLRFSTVTTFEGISKKRPNKGLSCSNARSGGRNNMGRMTVRHRGGGHKRLYRMVDFKREKFGVPARVASLEYDPNRSARIPIGLEIGSVVVSGPEADILVGNALPLKNIPLGTTIHNIELRKGKGAQLARSAGSSAQLVAKEGAYAQVRMPSSEVRRIHIECLATVGQVGNLDHSNTSLGKAGRWRWLGRRSSVRGVAMNPIDHPHGGGEGRSSGGRHPVTPWGQPTRGFKTRNNKRTDQFIVKRRGK